MTIHADTAKAIRKELKKAFPLIKFSVTSQSYSGGNSVAIEWINGPTSESVGEIVYKYQYGHFNGMEDIYENTNSRNDIPQVKYVQVRRNVSEDIKLSLFERCRLHYAGWENLTSIDQYSHDLRDKWGSCSAREFIYRLTCKEDLTHGYQGNLSTN